MKILSNFLRDRAATKAMQAMQAETKKQPSIIDDAERLFTEREQRGRHHKNEVPAEKVADLAAKRLRLTQEFMALPEVAA